MSVGRRLGGFALAALVTAGVLSGCAGTEPAAPGLPRTPRTKLRLPATR